MINPELYNKTVDILVQAYFNDTLVSGDYCGCAVGNIVAANMGLKTIRQGHEIIWDGEPFRSGVHWYDVIRPGMCSALLTTKPDAEIGAVQIKSTGYTRYEIDQIERAFESSHGDDGRFDESAEEAEDRQMFEGLMYVINALDQIHHNKEPLVTEVSKKKFVKA